MRLSLAMAAVGCCSCSAHLISSLSSMSPSPALGKAMRTEDGLLCPLWGAAVACLARALLLLPLLLLACLPSRVLDVLMSPAASRQARHTSPRSLLVFPLVVMWLNHAYCSQHTLPWPSPLHGPLLLLRSALAELAPKFYAQAKPHIEAAQRYWQQQVALTAAAAAADGEAPLPAGSP